MHSSKMPNVRLLTVSGESAPSLPLFQRQTPLPPKADRSPHGHTNMCKNITFPQLRLRAVKMFYLRPVHTKQQLLRQRQHWWRNAKWPMYSRTGWCRTRIQLRLQWLLCIASKKTSCSSVVDALFVNEPLKARLDDDMGDWCLDWTRTATVVIAKINRFMQS